MESKRKHSSGHIQGVGEVVAGAGVNAQVLKKERMFKLIHPKHTVGKHPIRITVSMGGTIPIAAFTSIKFNISLEAPVDLSIMELSEAYAEARELVLAEAGDMQGTLKDGIIATVDKVAPSAGPVGKGDLFDDENEEDKSYE